MARAHPRSRGENGGRAKEPGIQDGSSPLTRGKLGCQLAEPTAPGLIPAHAGKTLRGHLVVGGRAAHPRSRGENSSDPIAAST